MTPIVQPKADFNTKANPPRRVRWVSRHCRVDLTRASMIDRLAFPATCGHGRSLGELRELAGQLLRDLKFYSATVAASQEEARGKVGYAAVAVQLQLFFKEIASGT